MILREPRHLTRTVVETPLPSNSQHDHMILRVDRERRGAHSGGAGPGEREAGGGGRAGDVEMKTNWI
jgi:hypothetical protein